MTRVTGDRLAFVGVLTLAILLAVRLYGQFLAAADLRWDRLDHDRNGHYLFALNLADDIRRGDAPRFIVDLDKAQAWPPLHGLVLAGVLSARGFDYRLGVLPSLAAWVGTAVFGFLLVRRVAPRFGNVAGVIAAGLILGSPAHQDFAVDVMLESAGACCSLATLYAYVAAKQQRSRWLVRALGLSLTLLFFVKGNYWLLVASSLVAAEVAHNPGGVRAWLGDAAPQRNWAVWLRQALRRPINYVLLFLLALIAVGALTRFGHLEVGAVTISFSPPRLLVTAAYAIVLIQIMWWWWSAGAAWRHRLDPDLRIILHWHIIPIAVWFLWPRRLAEFLWHVSPANAPLDRPFDGIWSGFGYYADVARFEYHADLTGVVLVLASLGVALVWRRRMRLGGDAVVLFLLIAAILTCIHPNRQSRYVHSWIAAAWVLSGVGIALLAERIADNCRPSRALAMALVALTIVAVPVIGPTRWPPQRRGSVAPPSVLELTNAYLPHLEGARRFALLSTTPMDSLIEWTCLERYGNRQTVTLQIYELDGLEEPDQQAVGEWLRRGSPDIIVLVDVPAGSVWRPSERVASADRIAALLESAPTLARYERIQRRVRDATITIWRSGASTP